MVWERAQLHTWACTLLVVSSQLGTCTGIETPLKGRVTGSRLLRAGGGQGELSPFHKEENPPAQDPYPQVPNYQHVCALLPVLDSIVSPSSRRVLATAALYFYHSRTKYNTFSHDVCDQGERESRRLQRFTVTRGQRKLENEKPTLETKKKQSGWLTSFPDGYST